MHLLEILLESLEALSWLPWWRMWVCAGAGTVIALVLGQIYTSESDRWYLYLGFAGIGFVIGAIWHWKARDDEDSR